MKIFRKKAVVIMSMLILLSFAAACSTQESGADIIDITWHWASLVENEPASQSVVPDPENYTLFLDPDGTMSIKADCNMVGGSYTVEGNALILGLGPSTMAFCGDESLDLMFTELLNRVESYSVETNQLVLILKDNAGNLTFSK